MSRIVSSLSGGLLVAKGTAVPSCFSLCTEAAAAPAIPPLDRPRHKTDRVSRLTLRIDAARHRRLRIAAAQMGKSCHALLLAALDHYLAAVASAQRDPRCRCLDDQTAGAADLTLFTPTAP